MARSVILGNGSLTVGLNEQGMVHDFYYPYVGLENLTTARSVQHKIGVWVDGTFSWVHEDSWEIAVDFDDDALITTVTMTEEELGIEITAHDCVDFAHDALLRNISVKNITSETRTIRLFMHQVFEISRAGRADTALFVPDDHYILDYKGRCSLLIYGQLSDGRQFDQFAIGNYGIEGKKGTYVDAEDGELSGSAVEHGGVDSVIRFSFDCEPGQAQSVDYWVVAAESQFDAEKVHRYIKESGLQKRQQATRRYWHEWFSIGSNALHKVDKKYLPAVKKSMMVIKAHTDKHGGVIAACDSSIYNYGRDYYSYVWPRDGAFALWPLIRMGYVQEPKQFFRFCRDILHPDGYLQHKFQPDKAIGSTWHPLLHNNRAELAIQEDETAIVLYMIGEFLHYSGEEEFVGSLYESFIAPSANFMTSFIDQDTGLPHASYDLWEEKFLTNTYTVAITFQALLTAADIADRFNHPEDANRWNAAAEQIHSASDALYSMQAKHYAKGLLHKPGGDDEVDETLDVSSLYGVVMFGLFNDARKVHATLTAVEEKLLNSAPVGGSPRYEDDNYFASDPKYKGNPWFVTTLWLAQYYARAHETDKATELVDWAISKAQPSGVLSEQVDPTTGAAVSVTPLVWSHAELINTVLDITK